MEHCVFALQASGHSRAHLVFSDFNRLRWVLDALSLNPALCAQLAQAKAPPLLTDSTLLWQHGEPRAGQAATHVVLWDGLNSLIELHKQRSDLASLPGRQWLFVGQLPEAEQALPASAQPLYPRQAATAPLPPLPPQRGPWVVRARAALRQRLRPWHNRLRHPQLHADLAQGGCIVFCGAVRHNRMLLDDSFRGAHLPALRQQLEPLIDLDWRQAPSAARQCVQQAVEHLCAAARHLASAPQPDQAAGWAALYNVLNLLHRQHTLSVLAQHTDRLRVVEFGQQAHFDPYDTPAYPGNLYLDFGSTCGAETWYPRRIDIERHGKPVLPCRLLQAGQPLAGWLHAQGAAGFARQAEADAQSALQRLSALKGNARARA